MAQCDFQDVRTSTGVGRGSISVRMWEPVSLVSFSRCIRIPVSVFRSILFEFIRVNKKQRWPLTRNSLSMNENYKHKYSLTDHHRRLQILHRPSDLYTSLQGSFAMVFNETTIMTLFYLHARPVNVTSKQSCKCLGSRPKKSLKPRLSLLIFSWWTLIIHEPGSWPVCWRKYGKRTKIRTPLRLNTEQMRHEKSPQKI